MLRKYGRQVNSALDLASFKSNKEIVQEGYNPLFIIQGTSYIMSTKVCTDISMCMRLPSPMSASEKILLRELVTLFEENLFRCNQCIKDFITCKDIIEEDLGSETKIMFYEDAVLSGEHQ